MHNLKKIPKKTRELIKHISKYDRKNLAKVRRILKRNGLEMLTESPEKFRTSHLVLTTGKIENYHKARDELVNLDEEVYTEYDGRIVHNKDGSYDDNSLKIYDFTIKYVKSGLFKQGFNRLY